MKNKEHKLKYTDMCIYIDEHVYNETFDEKVIYQYLYNLFYALSMKKKYFNRSEDYEKYSIYGATKIYLRLTNKRQFLEQDNPKKLAKVKSVLNLIKSVLYPLKVDFQKLEYSEILNEQSSSNDLRNKIKDELSEKAINECLNSFLKVDITCYFDTIGATIEGYLKENAHYKDKIELKNLCISCVLTLLRGITLSNFNRNKFFDRNNNIKLNCEDNIDRVYYEENLKAPIV